MQFQPFMLKTVEVSDFDILVVLVFFVVTDIIFIAVELSQELLKAVSTI